MKIRIVNKSRHNLPLYSTDAWITVLDSTGTIDADYRGEVCIILVNLSGEEFVIKNGERICQMVIAKHEKDDWVSVDNLDETDRGTGGFGHTGKE